MKTKIPVKRIKRAEIRYFESEHNGCEIPDVVAYTYFLELKGVYVNMFHPFEDCNIYKRVPYANSTGEGESFGTLLKLVNGNIEDGVCYVLDNDKSLFNDKEYISIEEFEECIINMNDFIVDRVALLESRKKINSKIKKIMKKDKIELKKLQDYINSKDVKKLKKIKN